MKYDIDKIRTIPILDVAEALGIQTKKKGSKTLAHCPWHSDEHPSMVIGGKYNTCKCFSCGKGGGVLELIQQVNGTDFLCACKWLEENGFEVLRPTPTLPKGGSKYSGKRSQKLVNKKHGCPPFVPPRGKTDGAADDKTAKRAEEMMRYNRGDKYRSSFARCLMEVFGEQTMRDVVDMYCLRAWKACGRYDDVLFPSIDINGECRDMKGQAYDCDIRSERFFHRLSNCYWLGGILYPDRVFDRNCLFGENLLAAYPNNTVALVESPKNACVGYAWRSDWLWLATGNKSMLTRDILSVLRGRMVVVIPDEDAFDEWKEKLDRMSDLANFIVIHSPSLKYPDAKADIADWILDERRKTRDF